MKPYKLKLKDVRRKAREAYKAGLLTAQSPFDAERCCVYLNTGTDRERYCAIGAGLPKKLRQEIADGALNATSVSNLVDHGIIAFASVKGRLVIERIQNLHDAWCANPSMGAREYEAKFKQAIGLK